MQTLSATYKGKSTSEIKHGKTYIIEINKNSMIVNVGKLKLPYKSLWEFLNNWDNIQEV